MSWSSFKVRLFAKGKNKLILHWLLMFTIMLIVQTLTLFISFIMIFIVCNMMFNCSISKVQNVNVRHFIYLGQSDYLSIKYFSQRIKCTNKTNNLCVFIIAAPRTCALLLDTMKLKRHQSFLSSIFNIELVSTSQT